MEILAIFTKGACACFFFFAARWYFQSKAYHHRVAAYLLTLWVILTCLQLFCYTDIPNKYYIEQLISLLDMTAVPGCVFLLFSLSQPRKLSWQSILANEAPVLLLLAAYAFTKNPWIYHGAFLYSFIYGFIMLSWSRHDIKRYHKKLLRVFSNLESRTLEWVVTIQWLFLFIILFWGAATFMKHPAMDTVYNLVSIILWHRINYYIAHYIGVEKGEMDDEDIDDEPAVLPESNESMSPASMRKEDGETTFSTSLPVTGNYGFEKELERLITEDKIWLNPSITINDIAQMLGTNRTYLSRYINNDLGQTFFDYINSYRIAMAEKLLGDSIMSIDAIATETGFNSTMNFRRVFAKKHNCTPGQYRAEKTMRKSED